MLNESIPKTYLNVLAATNFAEFYGKRLANPYTCPYDGARNNSCACTNDGHVQAGLSLFSKVRVDLQNMKINPNDHTFALTDLATVIPHRMNARRDTFPSICTGNRLVDDLQWTSKAFERVNFPASYVFGLSGLYLDEESTADFSSGADYKTFTNNHGEQLGLIDLDEDNPDDLALERRPTAGLDEAQWKEWRKKASDSCRLEEATTNLIILELYDEQICSPDGSPNSED
uniref:GON domain-containing protein n=1 Tax=Globodera rostochiensis TaxID=31243 RepID=A0A914HDW2_GLORO